MSIDHVGPIQAEPFSTEATLLTFQARSSIVKGTPASEKRCAPPKAALTFFNFL